MSKVLCAVKPSCLALLFGYSISCAATLGAVPPQDTAKETKGATQSNDGLSLKPTRKLQYTTKEGTWLSLDVSPDGKSLIFDLVGHIYALPVGGGDAKPITAGLSFDSQPKFSPDGKEIVYISDRSGADNVWISQVDGSNARQLTSEENALFVSPSWTTDGRYILVSRAKPRAYGEALELWMYDVKGGSGVPVIQSKKEENAQAQVAMGAVSSPDGRYFYYETKAAGFSDTSKWQIARRDLRTGEEERLTYDQGGAFRPVLSPDGTKLAYATRYDSKTALRLRDLATGDDRWLEYPIQRDGQESGETTRDLLPGYAFTPDGKNIVLSFGGKIHRLGLETLQDKTIQFQALVLRELGPELNFQHRVEEGPIEARLIQGATESPDGSRVAFSALGHIYMALQMPDAKPQRITSRPDHEFEPAWSADGKWLAYVTWSGEGGSVWKVPSDRTDKPLKLSSALAYYSQPVWSPDGNHIYVLRAPRSVALEQIDQWLHPVDGLELVSIQADGKLAEVVTPAPHYTFPHFAGSDVRLFVTELQKPNLQNVNYSLVSMRADGSERRTIVRLTHKNIWGSDFSPPAKLAVSPDGTRALALFRSQVYLFDLPIVGGAAPTIDLSSPSVVVRRLTDVGADFMAWADNGKTIVWSLGSTCFRLPLAQAEAPQFEKSALAGGDEKTVQGNSVQAAAMLKPQTQRFTVQVPRETPKGTVALRGAKIVTMRGDEVLSSADIVVQDNRIQAIGASGSVAIPAGAKVLDVRGDTIVPGFIDIHAHWFNVGRGVLNFENWDFLASLAYGVTAGRDPQTYTSDMFAYQDLADSGQMIGPRAYSTGPGIFSTNDFQSEEEAEKVISRYKDYYRTNLIKSYLVGNRRQRQFVVEACEKLHMIPTTEGAADLPLDLTHVIDGYGGNEHQFPVSPLYSDLTNLVAKSGLYYTPTFILGYYDGPGAEDYYLETTDVYNNPKLRRFIPHAVLEARTSGLKWFRKDQYQYPAGAASAWDIVKAGGKLGIGGHGELQGLSFHWQMWSLQSGGMSNLEILRAATLNGAEAIGLARDLGSLEAGKLADLVVLTKDPLEDIQNSTSIRFVMKNGELFDGDTLNEVWPNQRTLGPFWWWKDHP
jgi:Tol biopolymer transport system component